MRAYTLSFIFFCVGVAFANGFYGNNSDIHWKAAGTDHFNFIYPAEYSSHAAPIISILFTRQNILPTHRKFPPTPKPFTIPW